MVMSCGVGHTHGLDLALLWLWQRLAATAPIRPLAWEPPNAAVQPLKNNNKKKNALQIGDFPFGAQRKLIQLGTIRLRVHNEVLGSIPGLAQWIKDPAFL